jgi:cellulose synthase/poly-beta-1,6-N-acetylglucosamine synthase-like glycosyltransferase
MDLLTPVSIIIPAWNDRDVLEDTLKSLHDLDFDKKRCQIIIVAGGDDGTYQCAKSNIFLFESFKECLVIEQLPNGKNAAIRHGLKFIDKEAKIVVLLDADTKVNVNWLSTIVETFRTTKLCALNGDYKSIRGYSFVSSFYLFEKIRSNFIENNASLYGGGSIAFRTEVLSNEKIKDDLFSINVLVGVDYNFSNILKDNGYKLGLAEKAYVYTYLPHTFGEFLKHESRWIPAWIKLSCKEKWFKTRLFKIFLLFIPSIIFFILSSIYPFYLIFLVPLNAPLIYYIHKSFIKEYHAYKISGDEKLLKYIPSCVLLCIVTELLIVYHYSYMLCKPRPQNIHFKGPRP